MDEWGLSHRNDVKSNLCIVTNAFIITLLAEAEAGDRPRHAGDAQTPTEAAQVSAGFTDAPPNL